MGVGWAQALDGPTCLLAVFRLEVDTSSASQATLQDEASCYGNSLSVIQVETAPALEVSFKSIFVGAFAGGRPWFSRLSQQDIRVVYS